MKAADERFEALPLPLKQAPQRVRLEPRQILSQGLGVFGGGEHHNRPQIASPNAEYALVDLGGLPLLGVRTTPCLSCEQGTGISTLALYRAGEACTYGTGPDRQLLEPGFIHLNPRQGIPVQVGYLAGLFCPIDHSRLRSTLAAIGGILIAPNVPFDAATLSLLIVNAYAAAIIGRLRSLPLTFLGAAILGCTEAYLAG